MQLRVFAYTMCPLPSAQRHRGLQPAAIPPIQALLFVFSIYTAPLPPPQLPTHPLPHLPSQSHLFSPLHKPTSPFASAFNITN